MSNAWINNALKPAYDGIVRESAAHTPILNVGGPMGVLVEPCDQPVLTASFYDQESDALTVHILPFEPYHSYLEAGDIRIDTDAAGRPVFVEAAVNRADWKINPQFTFPAVEVNGAITFRETRRIHSPGEVWSSPCREMACLRFLARRDGKVIRFSRDVMIEIADGYLVALWIRGISLDFGGRKQAAWRAKTAYMLRKNGREWRACTGRKLSKSLSERE